MTPRPRCFRRPAPRRLAPGPAGLLLAAALAAGLAPPAHAADADPAPTLEAFMRGMAGTSGVVARFHEVKEIGLLSVPLEVRGTLWFVPPDRLARVTTEPARTRLVIDGDRFAFRDEAGGETLDLAANPLAREFVDNFIVLFNGDLGALRARYEPDFRVDGESWRLTLRPRGAPLSRVVEQVVLEGEGRRLARMELRETDGDRTTTRFTEVEIDRRFDAEEQARIFAVPGEAAEPR